MFVGTMLDGIPATPIPAYQASTVTHTKLHDFSSPPLRVLLLVNQKLLVGLLHLQNYCVTVASDGQQAVERMAEEEFDVVLMDVQMPIMDGLTATRLIRQKEAGTTKRTPILAVTVGMDRQSCLEAGMDDYLEKPVRADSLQEKLDLLLRN